MSILDGLGVIAAGEKLSYLLLISQNFEIPQTPTLTHVHFFLKIESSLIWIRGDTPQQNLVD